MGRWLPDAQGRLQTAAMELYAEQGFDQTTVAQIAARAGLTERTFFRYFADKREVLFAGGAQLQDAMVAAAEAAPPGTPPMETVAAALEAGAELLEVGRDYSARRQSVIASSAELRERELIKLASLAEALVVALRRRGVPEPAASLTAEAGVAVFRVAFDQWAHAPGESELVDVIRSSVAALRAVASA